MATVPSDSELLALAVNLPDRAPDHFKERDETGLLEVPAVKQAVHASAEYILGGPVERIPKLARAFSANQ